MSKKISVFFVLTIILIITLIGLKHFGKIEFSAQKTCGILYYTDYSNGTETYSLDLSTNKVEKIVLDNDYEILDYSITSDGYYCIVREQTSSGDIDKSYFLHHANDTDKKIIIPNTSGKLSLVNDGILFLCDYYTTSKSFTLSYCPFNSNSIIDIKSDITDYCVLNNIIYFIKDDNLFQLNFDTNVEKLVLEDCTQVVSNEDNLVFVKTDNGIYKYNAQEETFEKFSEKNNYRLIAIIDNSSIIVTKQDKSENEDQLEYNPFKFKSNAKYYILSNNKLIHIKELDGYSIDYAHYFNKEYNTRGRLA